MIAHNTRFPCLFALMALGFGAASGCLSGTAPSDAQAETGTAAEQQGGASPQSGSATGAAAGSALRVVPMPVTEPAASQRDVASLQSRVDASERQLAALRSEVALIKRGLKTGLFEPVSGLGDADGAAMAGAPAPHLGFDDPSLSEGQVAASDPSGKALVAEQPGGIGRADLAREEEPYALIEKAIASIEKKDYPAALVTLTALRERYPGYSDEGLADVLTAESWNAIKAPEKALAPVERFVAVHGSSRLLPRAKLAQADAYAALGERQKSIELLLEVISLAPETPSADAARSRLAALRIVK